MHMKKLAPIRIHILSNELENKFQRANIKDTFSIINITVQFVLIEIRKSSFKNTVFLFLLWWIKKMWSWCFLIWWKKMK